jgi:uncharacterized protein
MTSLTGTGTEFLPMRLAKVVAIGIDDGSSFCVVLESVDTDTRLPIWIGDSEGLYLSAALTGVQFGRPMSPRFAADLLHALGGRVRQVRIDRLIEVRDGGIAYGSTVEVEGPAGVRQIDARPSDALNLVALAPAPVLVAAGVLAHAQAELEGDSPEAARLRLALEAPPATIRRQPSDP